jgi:hypothetical protein
MQPHQIVSREEWIEARKAHLAREKELTQAQYQPGPPRPPAVRCDPRPASAHRIDQTGSK